MKLRKHPHCVKAVIKKADAIDTTEPRLSSNKRVTRHRTARYSSLPNVKKEEDDYKDALNTLRATLDEKGTAGVSPVRVKTEIKQEDMAKASLRTTSQPNTSGHSYLCKSCDITFKNFKMVLNHQQSVHNKPSKIKHINVEPDINDPSHYCKSCESFYPTKGQYRQHLRKTHYMIFGTEFRIRSRIAPDPEDPNHYCCSCQRFYPSKGVYRRHLRAVHKMHLIRLKPIKNPDIVPDWNDPNLHCSSCNFTYKSSAAYVSHCINIHRLRAPVKRKDGLPDLDDLNNYCKISTTLQNSTWVATCQIRQPRRSA
ncbi:hypothetical protein MBANPS3_007844 [Mucor bainieri]